MKTIFGISHRFVSPFSALLIAVALVFAAQSSEAAKILNLRTGKNVDHTRIVIELDQPTSFQQAERAGANGAELVVDVKAAGQAQTVDVSTPFVRSMQVKPSGAETQIIVQLPQAGASVKEFILQNPPRIVLDIARGKVVAASSAPTASQAASAAKPTSSQEASKPVAAATSAKNGSTKTESPISVGSASAPIVAPAPGIEKSAALTDELKPHAAVSMEDGTSAEAAADDAEEIKTSAPAKKPAVAPKAKSPVAQAQSFVEKITSQLEGLPALIGSGVLVVLVLLVLVLKRRKKAVASVHDEEVSEEEDEGDEDSLFGGEPWETDRARQAKQAETPLTPQRSLEFSAPSVAAPVRETAPTRSAAPSQSFVTSPSTVSADAPSKAEFEALEGKLKGLEDQVNAFTAARERLEAQIKSQSEELRVQRAAIARTQRVVRSLASAEDDMPASAEPAPKAPID